MGVTTPDLYRVQGPCPVIFASTTNYAECDLEIVATALMEYAGTPDCQLPGTAK
jgi:hypothetical protein